MKETKYIVYKTAMSDEMVIFGATQTHSDIAYQLGVRDMILSAGFLSVGQNHEGELDVSAYGDSVTLKVGSRPEDTLLARRVLGIHQW